MHRFLEATVREYMTSDVVTVTPDTPMRVVEELFTRHRFHGVPVVVGDALIGIATTLDVLTLFRFTSEHMLPAYADLAETPVAAFMTAEPVTVEPATPLTRVLDALVTHRILSLPVLEDGRLVGIIGRTDVVRALRDAGAAPT